MELLIVVAIIAILAGIALPQYLQMVERGRASEALVTLQTIRNAELRFQATESPTDAFTTDVAKLDIKNVPLTLPHWTIDLSRAADATPVVTATRTGFAARTLTLHLDTGAMCPSAEAALYKIPVNPACPAG